MLQQVINHRYRKDVVFTEREGWGHSSPTSDIQSLSCFEILGWRFSAFLRAGRPVPEKSHSVDTFSAGGVQAG